VGNDLITREERQIDLLLGVDLDFAETQIGKRVLYLGIPIFKTHPYSPPPGPTDKYEGLRKWYRRNIETSSGIFIVHRIDLQRSLAKAQPDAVDYLVTENENERAKHEGWLEPGNEAVEIENWILPAGAIDKALLETDFRFKNIEVTLYKGGVAIEELMYFVPPKERTLYFSYHGKPAK